MSGLVVAGLLAALFTAIAGGAFVAIALIVAIPRAERDITRHRAF
jgi:hypothetical protein